MPYDKPAILNAINRARLICAQGKSDVISIVEAIIGEPLEEPAPTPPKTYRIGQKFDGPHATYLLACTGLPPDTIAGLLVGLINISSGIRWREAIAVQETSSITEDEMSAICGPHERRNFTEEIPF